MSEIGHNSALGGSARDQLRAFVERIERLEEEKAALAADVKEVFSEAKAMGFDVKTLRTVIRLRKQDSHEREEAQAILETYLHALGERAELTDEEKESGAKMAFISKTGQRLTVGTAPN